MLVPVLDDLKKAQSRMSELMEKKVPQRSFLLRGVVTIIYNLANPPYLPPVSQVISFLRAY